MPAVVAIENHPMDSRVRIDDSGTMQTLPGRMWTGGGNVPMTMQIRCGKEGGDKGALIQENLSATLSCANTQTLFEPDDRPAIAYGVGNGQPNQPLDPEKTGALNCMHDQQAVMSICCQSKSVRRLTPLECARLQGFPDWWCDELETPEPTKEEIEFWAEVWETHRKIIGKSSKPKSRTQLLKWLKDPRSDSAEYKMWGNGVALPCVCFVLAGIAEVLCNEDRA